MKNKIKKMAGDKSMKFNLLCTVSNGEVISEIDGKRYKHFLDAAKMNQFHKIYDRALGKALQYLKEQCSWYEVDDKRYTRVKDSNKFVENEDHLTDPA